MKKLINIVSILLTIAGAILMAFSWLSTADTEGLILVVSVGTVLSAAMVSVTAGVWRKSHFMWLPAEEEELDAEEVHWSGGTRTRAPRLGSRTVEEYAPVARDWVAWVQNKK